VSSLLVVADDRTGAMETAGMCADLGCTSEVTPFGRVARPGCDVVVIDLSSRHLSPAEAARRATSVAPDAAHKIDSTLRGNWAHEVVGRQAGSGRRVLVVPAFPAAGRTCVGGVVLVDGQPVSSGAAASDLRGGVRSSRPSDHLLQAGATSVDAVSSDTLPSWLDERRGAIAVCDASTDDDLRIVLSHWAGHRDVVLAGTAATIASAVAAGLAQRGRGSPVPERVGPALIVCGSLHPMALAQVAAAESAGAIVLVPESNEGGDPAAVAAALGERALRALDTNGFRTVVLIGGDTTAEVLGDAVVSVGGTIAPGVAWSRPWGESGPLVLTKPGGFGTRSTLVDLLAGALA
jgi:D-threonate/D-erythronate kinase